MSEISVLRAIERKLKKKRALTNIEMEIASSPAYSYGFRKYFKRRAK